MITYFKSNKNRVTLLIIAVLLLVALYNLKALFHPGLFTSHDGWHQVARLYHFNQAIMDGQFPPRWSGGLLFGFGYPLFIFSYHLPWWIGEIFLKLNLNIFDSIKAIFITTYALSGLVMYFWIRDMWGKKAGLIAALIYLLTPYRFAVILVRANIGEAVSLMCIPLVFWALYRLHKKVTLPSIILGSIGVVGFLLSHIMVVFLFASSLILYFLVLLQKTTHRRKFIIASVSTAILGFAGAAYYLLPALVYKPITIFTNLYHGLYRNHFTPLSKLLYSPWGYGAIGTPGEMSRQVGLVLWLVIAASCALLLYQIIRKKSSTHWWLSFSLIIGFLIAIFMMTAQSEFIWKKIESATLIDFPWRFLAVTTLVGSVLAGWLTYSLKGKLQLIFMGLLILAAIYTNRNHVRVNQYTDIPLSLYIASEITTNTDDEYLPTWVDHPFVKNEKPQQVIGNAKIENFTQTSNQITFTANAPKSEDIKIHHMFFPGQKAFVDGSAVEIKKSDKGAIQLILPQGEHQVKIQFFPTPVMRLGEFITFLAIGIAALMLAYDLKNRKKLI